MSNANKAKANASVLKLSALLGECLVVVGWDEIENAFGKQVICGTEHGRAFYGNKRIREYDLTHTSAGQFKVDVLEQRKFEKEGKSITYMHVECDRV
jgi:hypothetical protein